MTSNLYQYGLDDHFVSESAPYTGLFIARVTEQHRERYKAVTEHGEPNAVVSGKLAFYAEGNAGFPAVGDWVMLDREDDSSGHAVIHHILKRKSLFTRKAAGREQMEQVIAANIDTVFICMSLNADFNLRRLERYLTIAWDSMATPVVVLTKSDLCADPKQKWNEVQSAAIGVDVVLCSAENSDGLDVIRNYTLPGKTIAFIGSSGVGKSTLINRLMGQDILAVSKSVRMMTKAATPPPIVNCCCCRVEAWSLTPRVCASFRLIQGTFRKPLKISKSSPWDAAIRTAPIKASPAAPSSWRLKTRRCPNSVLRAIKSCGARCLMTA